MKPNSKLQVFLTLLTIVILVTVYRTYYPTPVNRGDNEDERMDGETDDETDCEEDDAACQLMRDEREWLEEETRKEDDAERKRLEAEKRKKEEAERERLEAEAKREQDKIIAEMERKQAAAQRKAELEVVKAQMRAEFEQRQAERDAAAAQRKAEEAQRKAERDAAAAQKKALELQRKAEQDAAAAQVKSENDRKAAQYVSHQAALKERKFYYMRKRMTWFDHRIEAEKMGKELAILATKEDFERVRDGGANVEFIHFPGGNMEIKKCHSHPFKHFGNAWIGATRKNQSNVPRKSQKESQRKNWRWIDGTDWRDGLAKDKFWRHDEPNNACGHCGRNIEQPSCCAPEMDGRAKCSCDEHYLVMSGDGGRFMDYESKRKFHAIYMDPVAVPNPYEGNRGWEKTRTPVCKIHDNTVSAFCYDTPVRHWGVGPEGIDRALGNCKHAAGKKALGFC